MVQTLCDPIFIYWPLILEIFHVMSRFYCSKIGDDYYFKSEAIREKKLNLW